MGIATLRRHREHIVEKQPEPELPTEQPSVEEDKPKKSTKKV